MTMNIHREALLQEGRVVIDEEYRGYDISIATWRGGEKPDIRVYKGDKDVTDEFPCCQLTEIVGNFDNIRIIMNEIDKREDKVGIKMKWLDSLPPGSNPFQYDMDRQGMQVGKFVVMHHDSCPDECVVVHPDTGARVKVDFSTQKEYYICIKTDYDAMDNPFKDSVWVCKECCPITDHTVICNWRAEDSFGDTCDYKLDGIKPSGRGILSCDICGQ